MGQNPHRQSTKKHTGLIVVIIVMILLILTGGGFLIWYFAYYNNPDKVVFDAMTNLLGAEHLAITDGQSYIKIGPEEEGFWVARLDFDTTSLGLPNATNAKLRLAFYEDMDASPSPEFDIVLGTVQLIDGDLYIKVGNLAESIDAALASQGLSLENAGPSAQLVYDFVAKIDGEWWRISYRDFLEMAGASQSQIRSYADFYTCMIDAVNRNHSAEFKTLYGQNPFVKVARVGALLSLADESYGYASAPAGYSFYEVSLDFDELAGFVNALPESQVAERFYGCYNQFIRDTYGGADGDEDGPLTADMFGQISADELREAIPDDYYLRLEISNFGHQVKHVLAANYTQDFMVSLVFDYKTTDAVAPSSYRPLTELFEEIGELMQGVLEEVVVWES